MNRKKLNACFAAGLFLFSPSANAAVFHPEHYTLSNGLEIVIIPGALSPALAQMVWYKAGSADDPAGKSGLAHYLEHLMFKGTDKVPPGGFSAEIAAQGGSENAFTGYDSTAYYIAIASDRLALAMQMEADRMTDLRLTPDIALPERAVVSSERQERTEDDPHGLFQEKLRAALFPGHPYGRPVIGWREEIDTLTPEDALAFYRAHYAPNNAVLAISGDVSTQEVLRLACATFGRLPPVPLPQRTELPSAKSPAQKVISEKESRVTQPYFVRAIVAPSNGTNAKKAHAIEVLSEVLGGGEVGLLRKKFVLESREASGIDVSYDPAARGESVFFIVATPASNGDVRKMEKRVRAYLAALAKRGIGPKLVQEAQKRLIDGAVFARDRLMAPANILGEALSLNRPIASVENWPQYIRAVRTEDVTKALRELLGSNRQILGFLEPEETTR